MTQKLSGHDSCLHGAGLAPEAADTYEGDQVETSYPGCMRGPSSTISMVDSLTSYGKVLTMAGDGNWKLRRFKLSQSQEGVSAYSPSFSHRLQGIPTPLLHSL